MPRQRRVRRACQTLRICPVVSLPSVQYVLRVAVASPGHLPFEETHGRDVVGAVRVTPALLENVRVILGLGNVVGPSSNLPRVLALATTISILST